MGIPDSDFANDQRLQAAARPVHTRCRRFEYPKGVIPVGWPIAGESARTTYPVPMAYLRFGFVAVNAIAFICIVALSLRAVSRESSTRVRRLWLLVSLVSGALVIGSIQRLVLQATILGWMPGVTTVSVVEDWQLLQSMIVVVLAIAAFLTIKKLASTMAATERIAGSILDGVGHVDVESLDLTRREREVLSAIGAGLLTDNELADELHISANTVQTHVKHLLRKTGLNRRQDLIAIAYLVDSRA